MEKKVKLTENELKTMIAEAICKILKEGQNDNPSNTHYAVHKPSNTIVFAWDYSGYDTAELRQYSNDYFKQDLVDMGMNPKEITILTRKSCAKRGIDPTDDSCWSNYPLTESIITEIGDTPKGQRAIGAVAGRALQRAKNAGYNKSHKEYKKQLNKYNSYSKKANQTQSNYANQLNGDKDYKDGFEYGKRKAMFEGKYNYSTTTIDINLIDIEFPEPLNEFMEENYDNMPDTVEVEISYLYNEYRPATYWQPAEGGDFEYYCSDVLTQPFENIIPQEMMQTFIDAVGEYTDNNIDDLFERANIDEDDYGPDPDEAYERWRDSRYED